ncbi:hypothetical protein [Planctomyces sp. SH-PL14]|uniref:hypothetical protein n=1 Tax=Planctomyces sp. SH-PL14 TaxID=1632864 RepID=UPI00078D9ED3|nr:hypothetical protein [Planctomyces sp. SH-PL14]AMV18272.1 hypothetical protein VT03_10310 [Planctomyces sp. SH-PL14]
MQASRDVFVIMPFSATASCSEADWSDTYKNVFKPAVTRLGYECERATPTTGSLIGSILERLRNARIVLADVTDRNANVFYELGVRHSLSRRTIVVARGMNHIPSDLSGYWTTIYGTKPGEVVDFCENVKHIIERIEREPDRSDSPVSDFLDREWLNAERASGVQNVKKVNALCTELSGTIAAIEAFDKGQRAASRTISLECLNLLLTTLYLDLGPDLLREAYELRNYLLIFGTDDHNPGTLLRCKLFLSNMDLVRRKMMEGSYTEPSTLSTMRWEPAKSNFMSSRCALQTQLSSIMLHFAECSDRPDLGNHHEEPGSKKQKSAKRRGKSNPS